VAPIGKACAASTSHSIADFLKLLFENLGTRHVRYCVLHSYDGLPGGLDSDLDLAIDGREWWRLAGVFAALDARGYHPIQCLRYAAHASCFIFGWLEGTNLRTAAVDFVSQNREGHLILAKDEDLLRDRRPFREFWIASSAVEYQYLLSRRILKGVLLPSHSKRLARLAADLGPSEAGAIGRRLFGSRWGNLAAEHSLAGSLGEILPKLRRSMWIRVVTRQPWMPVWYWLTELPRLASRIAHPTGFLLAVLGPDGTGKSTLIDKAGAQLEGAFRSTTRYHWRPQVIFNGESKPVSDPHARPPRGTLRSLAYLAGHVADNQLGFILRIRPLLTRTGLVLFDRYFHDVIADPKRYRYGGPTNLLPILAALVPKPDLMLVLDAPAETLLLRKKETTAQEITEARDRYRRLSRFPYAVLIDASKPADQVAREASQTVLNMLRIRFVERHPDRLISAGGPLDELIGVMCTGSSESEGANVRRMAVLPGSHDPRWLVPVNGAARGVDRLAVYSPYSRKARLMKAGLAVAMRMPDSLWAPTSLSLPSRTWIDDLARDILGVRDAQFTVSLGAPGPFRKATVQIIAAGRICGFVKVPLTADAQQRVEQEAAMLSRVSATPPLNVFVPEVIYAGEWNGRFILVEKPMGGKPGEARFGEQHRAFLKALAAVESHPRSLSALAAEIAPAWQSAASLVDEDGRTTVDQALSAIDRSFADLAVPCGVVHGDFAPWNTRRRVECLGVLDWEAAAASKPHDWDSFHFHVQTASLLDRDSGCHPDLRSAESRCSYILYLIDSLSKVIVEQGARAAAVTGRLARLAAEVGGLHGA
jgi:thymidylate kinase